MNLIRGVMCLFPCPRCFVPKADLSDLSLRFPHRTVEHTQSIREFAQAQTTKGGKEAVLKACGVRDLDVCTIPFSESEFSLTMYPECIREDARVRLSCRLIP